MNDFKKALIDVAGDLSDSERNVKGALQGKHKRPPKCNFLVVPVFIMAVCLIGFTLWLLPNKVEQQAATIFNNDYLYQYYMGFERMSGFYEASEENEEGLTNAAFERYKEAVAIQQFAKSKDIQYTKQQYDARVQQQHELNHAPENSIYEQMLSLSKLTEEQYEKHVLPILIENNLYMDALNAKWVAENPKLLPGFAWMYTTKLANDYLETYFEQDLLKAQEKYNITPKLENFGSSKSGTIAAVDGMMIYFIQNTTYEEIKKMTPEEIDTLEEERLKAWLINYDNLDVQVGDFVRVSVNATNTSYDAQITNGMAQNLEVIIPVAELAIAKIQLTEGAISEWQQLTQDAKWESPQAVGNFLTPHSIVQVEEELYTVFANDYNNLLLVPYGKQTIAKLTQGQSKKLNDFLLQFVTK